jgi:hypothetical protein
MKYKEAFVINETPYNMLSEEEKKSDLNFELDNFEYYEPKLIGDFYLKCFYRKFMFDIEIWNLEQFISYQYEKCNSQDDFVSIIKYKVEPTILDVIENAGFLIHEGYFKETKLEDDFVETEGVIKNYQYEFPFYYHTVMIRRNKSELLKRIEILKSFIEKLNSSEENLASAPMEWIAGSAQLGFIISMLVQNGYINPPMVQIKNGKNKGKTKINHSQLARDVLAAFKIPGQGSEHTLKAYLNTESYKHIEISKRFMFNGFSLPKQNDLD